MKLHLMIAIAFVLTGCSTSAKKMNANSIPPKLVKPVVKKIWIPEEIRNGGAEWVEGHYMYRIEQETTWSR